MNLRPGSLLWFAAPIVAAIGFGVVSFDLTSGPTAGAAAAGMASDPAAPAAPVEQAALVDQGRELFATQCSSCHSLDGRGVDGRGPTLEPEGEASADFVLRTGRMPIAAPDLQARPGPVRYSEDQILALVAYVGSIGSGPEIPTIDAAAGDVSAGAELYLLNCAACHVSSGAGAPVGGGRVAPNLTRSSPTEIGEAIRVGPGSMPVFASFSDDDIDDVAAYVNELDQSGTTAFDKFGGAGPVAEGLAVFVLALIPLIALTRWIGSPKDGRDQPVRDEPEGDDDSNGDDSDDDDSDDLDSDDRHDNERDESEMVT